MPACAAFFAAHGYVDAGKVRSPYGVETTFLWKQLDAGSGDGTIAELLAGVLAEAPPEALAKGVGWLQAVSSHS